MHVDILVILVSPGNLRNVPLSAKMWFDGWECLLNGVEVRTISWQIFDVHSSGIMNQIINIWKELDQRHTERWSSRQYAEPCGSCSYPSQPLSLVPAMVSSDQEEGQWSLWRAPCWRSLQRSCSGSFRSKLKLVIWSNYAVTWDWQTNRQVNQHTVVHKQKNSFSLHVLPWQRTRNLGMWSADHMRSRPQIQVDEGRRTCPCGIGMPTLHPRCALVLPSRSVWYKCNEWTMEISSHFLQCIP